MGSGGGRSCWPSYCYEWEDLIAQQAQGELERTQQMQNRGMQVIDVNRLLDRLKSEIVSCAIGNTPLHAAPGEQSGVTGDIMIATITHALQSAVLDHRRPAKFTADNEQRVLEKAARFEIVQQGGDRTVRLLG